MSDFPQFLSEYTYPFEESQIAVEPLAERSESKLLLVRRNASSGLPRFEDCKFSDLPDIVDSNPFLKEMLLVRNRTKVLAARFFATRSSGGRHEIVLTEKVSATEWKALIRNIAKIKDRDILKIENSEHSVKIILPDIVKFETSDVPALLLQVGKVPLPPYIKREVVEEDKTRYQSVWASGEALSAAAPTASLHFTDQVWNSMMTKIKHSADVYLHVGRGTFEALRENDLQKAELHAEAFEVAHNDAKKVKDAREVFAIGTTACRLVETLAAIYNGREENNIQFQETEAGLLGHTRLFVKPGYEFAKVKALLTNFHLPESSLFVLATVFAGSLQLSKEAYAYALKRNYRLFSYGDASLWL